MRDEQAVERSREHMNANPPAAMICLRRASAAAFVLVGMSALMAGPSIVADEPLPAAPSSPQAASPTGCVIDGGIERIFVRLECHESATLAAKLSPQAIRTPAKPAPRLQLSFAGLDLLASRPGEFQTTTHPTTPFDFPPGARNVGPLRWTWASVAWKF